MRPLGLAALSGISMGVVHEVAHSYYGATPDAIGSVGIALAVFALVGVGINGALLSRETEVDGDDYLVLLGLSGVTTYYAHSYAHDVLGASPEAITTISYLMGGLAFVGVMLNITGYSEGDS